MVKLDVGVLRYMSKEEFRVLTAVEMGMKNHEVVPTKLICQIAGLKHGGAHKLIGNLHRNKLIYHDAKKYDGYRLTYRGYDFLALKAFKARGKIKAVGSQIGVGKESDIFVVLLHDDTEAILKIHRLGRVSFRAVKKKRDYLIHRKSASWLYMSRLAAMREYAYMKALHKHGFPTPTPIDVNRHCILMSRVNSIPFSQVKSLGDPGFVYTQMMNLIIRLAEHGLIHCDFNEFNTMIHETTHKITMIDFPQMVSTSHKNAKEYFDRDVECVRTHFTRRFKFVAETWPLFSQDGQKNKSISLDEELAASGYKHSKGDEYEVYRAAIIGEDLELDDGDDEEDGGGTDDDAKRPRCRDEKECTDDNEVGGEEQLATSATETREGETEGKTVSTDSNELQNISSNLTETEENPAKKTVLKSEDVAGNEMKEGGANVSQIGDGDEQQRDDVDEKSEDEDKKKQRESNKNLHRREKKKLVGKALTREQVRARLKGGNKNGRPGRNRNVQKSRKKNALKERIKQWT